MIAQMLDIWNMEWNETVSTHKFRMLEMLIVWLLAGEWPNVPAR